MPAACHQFRKAFLSIIPGLGSWAVLSVVAVFPGCQEVAGNASLCVGARALAWHSGSPPPHVLGRCIVGVFFRMHLPHELKCSSTLQISLERTLNLGFEGSVHFYVHSQVHWYVQAQTCLKQKRTSICFRLYVLVWLEGEDLSLCLSPCMDI